VKKEQQMVLTIEDQRVRAVVTAELGLPADEALASDATFKDDLGADSMDSYNLVLALEEEFAIEIPDADIYALQTVRSVVLYVTARAGAAA
jgi:acyl carrier protein